MIVEIVFFCGQGKSRPKEQLYGSKLDLFGLFSSPNNTLYSAYKGINIIRTRTTGVIIAEACAA